MLYLGLGRPNMNVPLGRNPHSTGSLLAQTKKKKRQNNAAFIGQPYLLNLSQERQRRLSEAVEGDHQVRGMLLGHKVLAVSPVIAVTKDCSQDRGDLFHQRFSSLPRRSAPEQWTTGAVRLCMVNRMPEPGRRCVILLKGGQCETKNKYIQRRRRTGQCLRTSCTITMAVVGWTGA